MNGANIFNGMFGKIEAGLVRLDVNGNIAVRTSDGYKSYSTKSGRLVNCNSFVFDVGEEFFFVIPTNKVEVNDIILANGKNGRRTPKCVINVNDTYITVINYEDSTVEQILPERHVFMGSTYFYGKIVSLFNFNKGGKNTGFENILKFKMMSEMMNGGNGSSSTNGNNNLMGTMMMMSMMGNNGFSDMFNFGEMFNMDSITDTDDTQDTNGGTK